MQQMMAGFQVNFAHIAHLDLTANNVYGLI